MTQRLTRQGGDGGIVDDIAARIEKPVLAMTGVRVERDVGDDAQ